LQIDHSGRYGEVGTIEAFEKLSIEKQERIRNAAFMEFAREGYARASTNRIVQHAGIGKGMLFHYFGSKQALYEYLANYSMDYINEHYLASLDAEQTDFIESYRKASRFKAKAYAKNPYVFQFFATFYCTQGEDPIRQEVLKKLHTMRTDGFARLHASVGRSPFRADIGLPEARLVQMVRWMMEGYEKELTETIESGDVTTMEMEPLWEEYDAFLDGLKRIFYKGE
jgi:TetR/AcrR family transcriptional regulator